VVSDRTREESVEDTLGGAGVLVPEDDDIPGKGEQVGHFTVIAVIGRGGMGVVLLGYDARLHRRVAIKLITPRLMSDPETRARFLREARAIALVSHPNIVHVYEVGTHGPHLYMVMEYVEGQTLSAMLREGPLSWREAVRILSAAGRGLQAAHAHGVIHRDFKPSNVLVGEDGRVRVADFGIAQTGETEEPDTPVNVQNTLDKILAEEPDLTGNRVLGTAPYMAPEQHRREPIDARADQFAFCVSLFETLTGTRPYGRGSRSTLQRRKHSKPPELPAGVEVPSTVRDVLRVGLQPEREDRFADMDALLTALGRERGPRWVLPAVAGSVLCLAAVGLGMPTRIDACADAGDVSNVWNDDVRSRVREAFDDIDVGHAAGTLLRVEVQLDAYAESWSAMAGESCAATHVHRRQSEHVLDLRTQCLDRHRDALRSTVGLLSKADRAVAKNAATLVSSLPPNRACGDVERLSARVPLPEDPARREAILDLQRELADIGVLVAGGQLHEALGRLRAASDVADALEWPALQAQALMLQVDANDTDPALQEDAARRAVMAASRAGDASAEAAAWRHLLFSVGIRGGRVEEAQTLEVGLDAALARLDPDDHEHYNALSTKGALANAAGNYGQAVALFEEAIAEADRVLGPHDPRTSALRNNLGTVLLFEGKTDQALAQFETALDMVKRSLGPKHPRAAEHQMNIAIVHLEDGRGEQAIEPLRTSIALFSEDADLNARRIAIARSNLAVALTDRLALGEAKAQAEQSLAALESTYPAGHPHLAAPIHALGTVAAVVGDVDEARRRHEAALAILDAAVGVDHPNRAQAFLSLAELRIDVGEGAEVIDALEHARARLVEARGGESRAVTWASLLLLDARLNAEPSAAPEPRVAAEAVDVLTGLQKARALFVLARVQRRAGDAAGARQALDTLDAMGDLATAHALLRPRIEPLRASLATTLP
jgi:serine/threonine-protein kinase